MKKIFIILFLVFFTHEVFAECVYKSDFDECQKALAAWTQKTLEFVCVKWNAEKTYTQIVMDRKFKYVDKEVEKYILDLEKDKDKYFGENATESIFVWVWDIEQKFAIDWDFAKRYLAFCWIWNNTIFSDVLACVWTMQTTNALNYFPETRCVNLVQTKLNIAKWVAYNVIKLNKKQVEKDSKKTFQQEVRKSYSALHDVIMKNIWYLTKILKSWPSKTEVVHTQ